MSIRQAERAANILRQAAAALTKLAASLAKRAAPPMKKTAARPQGNTSGLKHLFTHARARMSAFWERLRDKPAGKRSLRLRLSVFFAMFLAAAWLLAAFSAWREGREYIDEFFDTQQMLFAKQLATADLAGRAGGLPSTRQMLPGVGKSGRGELEDDALAFAVFTTGGQMVLHDGGKGQTFVFAPGARGFVNARPAGKKDNWRIVWLESQDGRHVIAVGQELEYRQDMALDLLSEQLLPWLALLPVLLAGLFLLLSRELAPLRGVAKQLQARSPGDTGLLETSPLPSEVRPLAEALNSLFTRTSAMLERERSFISDAAHELRTPLAGLRVQAEVAGQTDIEPQTRDQALLNLRHGIDRSARLVEQLLALSRLEALSDAASVPKQASVNAVTRANATAASRAGGAIESGRAGLPAFPLDWTNLLDEALKEFRPKADKKDIRIALEIEAGDSPAGYASLMAMLLRNLLNNAVLYTPEGGDILIRLKKGSLTIANSGPGLPAAQAARLGERFCRPPGQTEPGSGLGLSIVRRISEIHGFALSIQAKTYPEVSRAQQADQAARDPETVHDLHNSHASKASPVSKAPELLEARENSPGFRVTLSWS